VPFAARKVQLFAVGLVCTLLAVGGLLYLVRPTAMFASPAFAALTALPIAIIASLALASGAVTSARLAIRTSTPKFMDHATDVLGALGYTRLGTEDAFIVYAAQGFPSRKVVLSIIGGDALITGVPRDVQSFVSRIGDDASQPPPYR